ncbi:MAG: hypothetical protein K6A42_03015 [Treponema sp.]|nr:hypothetical protein [Treponema sp.]
MPDSIFKKILNKIKASKSASPESLKAAQESMLNIINAFGALDQKAKNLSEKYPEQEKLIHQYFDEAKKIEPSVSVRAGKFEQALQQQITKVSSLIDKIFTDNDPKKLDSELKLLARYIRVRTNADSEESDE